VRTTCRSRLRKRPRRRRDGSGGRQKGRRGSLPGAFASVPGGREKGQGKTSGCGGGDGDVEAGRKEDYVRLVRAVARTARTDELDTIVKRPVWINSQ